MKAKIYVGAKKYALYIGRKIVEKTLEFLTLPARFVSKKVQELKNLTMWGQSVQDGIPTPTAPIEIESVGDRTKNLFDIEQYNLYKVDGKRLDDNGSEVDYATGSYSKFKIKVKSNTTYSCSRGNVTLSYSSFTRIYTFDKNGDFINRVTPILTNTQATFTTPENCTTIMIQNANDNSFENAQLEEGSTLTTYEPYGYKVPVVVGGGKNLFGGNYETLIDTYVDSSGKYQSANTVNTYRYFEVKTNTSYTISAKTPRNGGLRIAQYTDNKTFIIRDAHLPTVGTDLNPKITITTRNTTKYLLLSLDKDLYDIQLEEGAQATEYVPYSVTTNIYLRAPLRKIGEYSDTLSVDGTDVTVTRNIGSYIFNGSENWVYANQINEFNIINLPQYKEIALNTVYCMCDKYIATETKETNLLWMNSIKDIKYAMCLHPTGTSMRFKDIDISTDANAFKNKISNNNINVIYPLVTPTTGTYTIENPIQLEQGTITIDTDTKIKPSKINITGDIDNE